MNAPVAVRSMVERTRRGDDPLLIAPSRERGRIQSFVALMVSDVLALFVGFAVGGCCYEGLRGITAASPLAALVLPIFLTIALYNGAYSTSALLRPSHGTSRVIAALLLSSAAVVFIAFYTNTHADLSRLSFALAVACSTVALFWSRQQVRRFVAWRCGAQVINQLVIDDGGPRVDLPHAIQVSARALALEPRLDDPTALDRLGMVLRNIDRVVVSCAPDRRVAWAMMLKGANVDGEVLDNEVAQLGAQGARVINGQGMLLVSVGPLGIRARATKRLLDLAFAGGALLALLPLLAVVALAIKLEDRGPVMFVQRRMGRGNRFFDIYKFRSMSDAQADGAGAVSASRTDKRITRIGRFIRATSIDELPQLFNVMKGDMSLVGPRPHAIGSQAGNKLFWEVDGRYWHRHSLKPGLSGLAQVRGFRGATERESDLTNRLQSDLEYLEGWTIMRDIKIILMTLKVVVHEKAY